MVDIEKVTDGEQLRRAFGCFPSGVTALCALIDGAPFGIAASSFTSVSVAPPLVSVCMQDSSTSWPALRTAPRLGLSVLAEGHDKTCRQLATRNWGERFTGIEWTAGDSGSVFIHGATAWLDCSVREEVPAGDHSLVLLEIHGLRAEPDTPPLVYHSRSFRKLAAL